MTAISLRQRAPRRRQKARPAPAKSRAEADTTLPVVDDPSRRAVEALYRLAGDMADGTPRGPQPDSIDRMMHALIGRATAGISPAAVALANLDWAVHLASSPGKQMELVQKAVRKAIRFALHAGRAVAEPGCPACIEPLPQDRRFAGEAWQQPPFSFIYQAFLLTQQWWHNATTGIRGVAPHSEQVVDFIARQLLDARRPQQLPSRPIPRCCARRWSRAAPISCAAAVNCARGLGARHRRPQTDRHR